MMIIITQQSSRGFLGLMSAYKFRWNTKWYTNIRPSTRSRLKLYANISDCGLYAKRDPDWMNRFYYKLNLLIMKTFFLSVFVLLSFQSFAQFDPLLYSWGDYNGTYSVSAITENGNNFKILKIETVTLNMLKARKHDDLVAVLSNRGLNSCNNVEVYEITKDGKTRVRRDGYWMLPGNDIVNPNNEHGKFYSEGEICGMFPTLFQTKGETKSAFNNRRIKTYEFDSYYQQYFESKSDFIKCEHPTRTDKDASRATYSTVFDEISNNVVAVYPAERSKEDKYKSMKNFEVIITNPSCEILNKNTVQFDYPRVYKEQIAVLDINDPKKTIGQFLIFERLNAGKKIADPDKSNVRIVYCSDNGDVISALLKFRPDNKGWEKIHGVFGDGESIYVSYHAYGSNGSYFGLKQINKNGEIQDFKYTEEQLNANIEIPTGNFGELNRSRKILGSLSEDPGFNWNTQEFKLQGIQKTATKLYVWGQAKYSVGDPDYKGDGIAPRIDYFAEAFVFVYNNSDLAFNKVFMLNIPPTKVESTFRLISREDDMVEFFIPIESPEDKDYSKTIVKENLDGKERYNDDYNRLLSPLFMTINGAECKFKYYGDVNVLDLENGLITCRDGSRFIVGFDAYAGESRDDAGELAYRNKHYFHFVPVNY